MPTAAVHEGRTVSFWRLLLLATAASVAAGCSDEDTPAQADKTAEIARLCADSCAHRAAACQPHGGCESSCVPLYVGFNATCQQYATEELSCTSDDVDLCPEPSCKVTACRQTGGDAFTISGGKYMWSGGTGSCGR